MGLTSFFQRQTAAPTSADPADAVQHARTRARQRLIGAIVLVGIGIVAFPLVFETQPRPIPVDIPIEVPRKESAAPLVMPPAHPPAVVAPAPAPAPRAADDAAARPGSDAGEVITESRDEPAAAPAKPPAPVPATPPGRTPDAKPHPTPDDGARARALLEGKPTSVAVASTTPKASASTPATAADGARFVVQVGAFADAAAARDTRLKVEQLGMKTYTQVASTAAGNRIRVRVGPFASRDEADKALAKARAAGLTAVVLTL